jgi:TRAP-type C4-dicarboxylate transport system substrate-binding protein
MARTRLATLALAATAALVAVASGSGGGDGQDKAGGSNAAPVLRLANTNGDLDFTLAVVDFVERVEELSGGDLRVETVDEWGDFASDAEQQVVKDVAAGEVDLGWVGTRVFDTLDVKSFQALTAPMLIDSYALEDAVIDSGITERMMPALDDLGVVALGVLPDGLRRPIGVTGPILGPADWQGLTFGTLRSSGQAEAIRALGATPAQVHREGREAGLERGTIKGFETSIWSHRHDPELAVLAPYVTSNVTLWPQMDVLLANPARLEALSGAQREWLKEAAHDAARSAVLADADARVIGDSCASGVRFAQASDADLAALEAAFAPVYAELQRQPGTKAFIERIQSLKRATVPEPELPIPPDCTGKVPAQPTGGTGAAPARLNGIYRYLLTQEDADTVGDRDKGYPLVNTITLKDGHLDGGCFGSQGGTYTVDDDRITFDSTEYDPNVTVTFSVDDHGDLHLTPVAPIDPGIAFTCFYKPWTKID